ncbi:unnamed protein product [Prunus armeniaca]
MEEPVREFTTKLTVKIDEPGMSKIRSFRFTFNREGGLGRMRRSRLRLMFRKCSLRKISIHGFRDMVDFKTIPPLNRELLRKNLGFPIDIVRPFHNPGNLIASKEKLRN